MVSQTPMVYGGNVISGTIIVDNGYVVNGCVEVIGVSYARDEGGAKNPILVKGVETWYGGDANNIFEPK